MTQLRILATAPRGHEFAIAAAIDAMGGLAVAPRHVIVSRHSGKPDGHEDVARWPGYIFLSLDAALWHAIKRHRMVIQVAKLDAETGKSVMAEKRVNPPSLLRELGAGQWRIVQGVLQQAEAEYQLNMARIERQQAEGKERLKLPRYKRDDLIELLDGLFAGHQAKVSADTGIAVVQGVQLLGGRDVEVQINATLTRGIAAE